MRRSGGRGPAPHRRGGEGPRHARGRGGEDPLVETDRPARTVPTYIRFPSPWMPPLVFMLLPGTAPEMDLQQTIVRVCGQSLLVSCIGRQLPSQTLDRMGRMRTYSLAWISSSMFSNVSNELLLSTAVMGEVGGGQDTR